jgi:hypothetical protein
MPSITDIYTKLSEVCTDAVYPDGTGSSSITGTAITVRPGFVDPNRLDALLAAGNSNVSINVLNGYQRNCSRYAKAYVEVDRGLPTLLLGVDLPTKTVIVAGTITAGEIAIITSNGISYAYVVNSSDTVDTIATELAALIAGASALNNIVTIPDTYRLATRVGVKVKVAQMLKRQEMVFEIVISSANFDDRATIEEAIEAKMAESFYLDIPDDTAVHILWMGTKYQDQFQKMTNYQCQLTYKLEFDTTSVTEVPEFNAHSETINLTPGLIP